MRHSPLRERSSRALQTLDRVTSRVGTVITIVVLLISLNTVLALYGFPNRWQVLYSTVTNTVVVIMLFALKHTESRQQTALQLKLDELILALPTADNHLVQIEHADEQELSEREQEQIAIHESLRNDSNEN